MMAKHRVMISGVGGGGGGGGGGGTRSTILLQACSAVYCFQSVLQTSLVWAFPFHESGI